MTLTVTSDRHLVRATQPDTRHLLVKLAAPKAPRKRGSKPARPPVNVCFVLDRSGSMTGQKIALARHAVHRAIQGLSGQDRFSIVIYDDRVDLLVGSQRATAAAKHKAAVRLDATDARGSTALHAGWSAGADAVRHRLESEGVNRVLLLTDGLANVGVEAPAELAAFAADLRASGVTTSTFGVGADFDEALLQAIADAGGGHFYFIEHPEQIPDFMTGELGELLETVARQVVIDVKHAPDLLVEPVSPIVAKAAVPGELRILVGDLIAEQDVELVLAVHFPVVPGLGVKTSAFFTVADRDQVLKADGCTVDWESADAAAVDAETPAEEVLKAVARLKAAAARQQAVAFNRAGDFRSASQVLSHAVSYLATFEDSDSVALRDALHDEEAQLRQFTSESNRKAIHYRGSSLARSRDAQGRARRNQPSQGEPPAEPPAPPAG